MRAALALVVIIATACGHGGGAPPVDEPPLPVTTPADAAPTPPAGGAGDAALVIDARPIVDGSGAAYPANRRIKGTITKNTDEYVQITFERPVSRGWAGHLWDEAKDKPVPNSGFVIMGIMRTPPDHTVGATLLPRPLSSYGEYATVRVVERYDSR